MLSEWIELGKEYSKERFPYLVGNGMNERIKELYEEAIVLAELDEQSTKAFKDRVLLNFAELIVRECVAICESGTPTQTTSGGAAEIIKLKFGILD